MGMGVRLATGHMPGRTGYSKYLQKPGRVSTRPGARQREGDTAPEVLNPSPGVGRNLGARCGAGGSPDMESLVSSIQIFNF